MVIPAEPERRRGLRMQLRVRLTMKRTDRDGRPRQESIETEVVNDYGFMFHSVSILMEGEQLEFLNPANSQATEARVIWCGETDGTGRQHVGVELLKPVASFFDTPKRDAPKTERPTPTTQKRPRRPNDTWVD